MQYKHIPVMLKEVLEYLNPKPGENFIDCTLGGGGYTAAIANKIKPEGKVLAIDLDKMAVKNAKDRIQNEKFKNIILINDNFKNLQKIVKNPTPALSLSKRGRKEFKTGQQSIKFSGIVFDLGLSSAQLQDKGRGFSFKMDASLNMAFGHSSITTEEIVNSYQQDELEKIISEYGEERFAKRISKAIVRERQAGPIKTTGKLVEIIKSAVPKKYLYSRIHPATRTFQALRIATNNELENLGVALSQSINLLNKGGRIVVISYHSLEDRIVKRFFKQESKDCICPPRLGEAEYLNNHACRCQHKARLKIKTKRVIRPSDQELNINPSARSAKLRAAERL